MRARIVIAGAIIILAATNAAFAKSSKIETAGQVVAFGLPLAAGAYTLYEHDDTGLAELGASWVISVGTAYGLSHIVREQRPDHSDFHSFPSDTAASGYSAADYLWGRYGWEYGVPAYALAMFAGYSRVNAKKHHWYDVLASSAIAFGVNYAIVTRYRQTDSYNVTLGASPDGAEAHIDYRW